MPAAATSGNPALRRDPASPVHSTNSFASGQTAAIVIVIVVAVATVDPVSQALQARLV